MRNMLFAACLASISVTATASCDDVKAQIDAKLQAKGITSYTLDIVAVAPAAVAPAASGAVATPAKSPDGKVVGNCEGETKQIIYKRN